MQRRVDEANHDREAVHRPEEPSKVIGLEPFELRESGVERLDRLTIVRREVRIGPGLRGRRRRGIQDHAPDRGEAVLLEEHVLGPAQADPLRAERARALRIAGVVGVGPDLEAAHLVGPAQQRGEVVLVLEAGLDRWQLAGEDLACRAVDADELALGDRGAPGSHLALGVVDLQRLGAGDARQAHRAGHDRSVRGRSPTGGQDALCGQHAVDVVRRGLDADEDDRIPGLLGGDGAIGVEDRLAHRGAG